MNTQRRRIALLLSLLTLEGILITDPVRPWLPFSLWTFDTTALSIAGVLAFAGLALVGAFLPFSFPGLRPLPPTFPLIGAALLLYGLPMAAALATATTALACWRIRDEGSELSDPLAGWPFTLAGFGLGLLIADIAGYVMPLEPGDRGSIGLGATVTACLLLQLGAALAVLVARHLGGDRPLDREGGRQQSEGWGSIAVGGAVSAALSLMAAQAVRIWGLGPVAIWLAPPFAVMAPLALAVSRERRRSARLKCHADGVMQVIEAVALAIEAKDLTSALHLRRMRAFALGLGRRLGMNALDLSHLEMAALLHDIGKLAVPEWILSKPGRLTAEEHHKMTVHSETGAGILEAIPYAKAVAPLVRHHHEHYDGTGYPAGLAGVEIPLGARILAVVDAVESITSERSYRLAVGRDEALAFIDEKAGTLFDPRVVKVLIENYDALDAEAEASISAGTRAGAAGAEGEPHGAPVESSRLGGLGDPAPDLARDPATAPMQDVLDTIASSHMEIYSLHEIGQALGKALNVEESLSLIAGRISRLFHYSACAIFVWDREREILVPRLTAGNCAPLLRELEIQIGVGPSGWAAQHGRSIIGAPPPDEGIRHGARSDLEPLSSHDEVAGLTSCLAAPLMADSEVVGVVALYDTGENPYSPAEERLLAMIGRQVGQAVRNGLLFERTQEATLTDALTGLPNTRYMFVAVEQELARARDRGMALSVLVMDIDRFGHVNEECGHPVGDRYLIGVSKLIRTLLRDHDTCVRYSGDEFVAILPGVAREEAIQVAERIRRAVSEFSIDGRSGRRVRTTISLGHATYTLDGESFEDMILTADERLAAEKLKRRSEDLAGSSLLPFRRPKQASDN